MSTDYYAYAVIGLKIDPTKLYKEIKIRNCDCTLPEDNKFTFCPHCGQKVYQIENHPIDEVDDSNSKDTLCGYPIIYGTDRETAYVAIYHSAISTYAGTLLCDKNSYFSQFPYNIEDKKNEMKNKLGPLGFWDEKMFGLWAVLFCSY